ncbi:MAG: hypothetical protein WBK55_06965 [Alphaproteobacteria bacterium]
MSALKADTPEQHILNLCTRSFLTPLDWARQLLDAGVSDDPETTEAREELKITPVENPGVIDCAMLICEINLRNQRFDMAHYHFKHALADECETLQEKTQIHKRYFEALMEMMEDEKLSQQDLNKTAQRAENSFLRSGVTHDMSRLEILTTLMKLYRDAGSMAHPARTVAIQVTRLAKNNEAVMGVALNILSECSHVGFAPAGMA